MPPTQTPTLAAWRSFLDAALAALGALLLLSAVVYFVAGNWADLPRLAKFALLEGGLVAATLASLFLPRRSRQLALAFAAGLIGPLLAVYGQSYQTGADPWELFAGWALLAIPFALAARFKPVLLGAVLLLNLAICLYWDQVQPLYPLREWAALEWLLVVLAAVNAAGWLTVEVCSLKIEWLSGRALARALALLTVLPALPPVCFRFIRSGWIQPGTAGLFAAGLLGGALLAMLLVYRSRHADRFMLSAACWVAMTVATFAAGRGLLELLQSFESGLLLLAAFVVGEVALAATWLRRPTPRLERA